MLEMLLPFALIFVIMYFLILRPQRQQAKRREDMLKAIRRGDTVVTNGGIVGKVTKVVDDHEVELQIAEGVRVRAMRDGSGQVRVAPVAGSSRCSAGARMSIQYSTCSGSDQTGHSPSWACASSTQVTMSAGGTHPLRRPARS